MLATYGRPVNRVLNRLGFQLIRRSTFDQLVTSNKIAGAEPAKKVAASDAANEVVASEASDVVVASESAHVYAASESGDTDNDLRSNEAAHNFRSVPRDGEPVETVPVAYLKLLQRESLALRDQSGELLRLRRELAEARQVPVRPAVQKPDLYTPIYDYTGLRTDPAIIHNHDFMKDPRFVAAYKCGAVAEGEDPKYFWRTHVALWCAGVALALGGDFVECGVCRGMLSSSIMTYLDWNKINRRFFLFDTFIGLDETQVTDEEAATGNLGYFREMYKEDLYPRVVRTFSAFKNVEIIQGSVPSTLTSANIGQVAYLSIDMNNATPEIAAANYFWDKLQPGAPILLDDYGFVRYEVQKRAFDAWAAQRQVPILALPTGQGLIIKPPA